jgi:uncharacterized protein (TIGR02588 family)
MSSKSDETSTSDEEQQSGGTSVGEWALGILGILVTVALLGFLSYQAVIRDSGPQLQVVVTGVQDTPSGFVTTLRVQNDGGQTAQGVHVTGEVVRNGSAVDTGSTTVGYVPPSSHRQASLVFTTDPQAAGTELSVEVAGYSPM